MALYGEYYTIEDDHIRIIKGEGIKNGVLTRHLVNEILWKIDDIFQVVAGKFSRKLINQMIHNSYFIEIGGDIRRIEDKAFCDCCNSIDHIRIANLSETPFMFDIGKNAFDGCTHLNNFEILGMQLTVVNICQEAFRNCVHLTNVVLSCSGVNLEEKAFWGCSSLRRIRFPDVIVSSSDFFAQCKSLEKIYIPKSILKHNMNVSTIRAGSNAQIILYDDFNEYDENGNLFNNRTNKLETQNVEEPETASIITPQTSKSTIRSYNGVIRTNIIASKKNKKF